MKKKHVVRNVLLSILVILIIITPTYFFVTDYLEGRPKLQYNFNDSISQSIVTYPDTQFAVLSDLHYYDNSLGTTGTAFEKALGSDRKLLKESGDLIDLAVDSISKSGVKFVLISGDITKDGELVCHQKLAAALSKLTQKGINVYVIPGNHDVNNPGAVKYDGDKAMPVSTVSPEQFAEIYRNFGFGNAIYRDSNSLSYVAEPVKNLWLVAIDSTRSRENKSGAEEIVGGKLSQNQERWLEDILKKAKQNGKAVIFMEHHGVVEHWAGQSKIHSNYLVQDYKYVGKLLASYDVRMAFTGHYHAQDITMGNFDKSGFLYDIETGSLITAPCPIRYCEISGNKIKISSTDLFTKYKPGTDFAEKATNFVHYTLKSEAYDILRKYFVSEKDSNYIADYVASAFQAHYNGDEDAAQKPEFDKNKLGLWSRLIYSQEKYIISGLYKDLYPDDNNITLNLETK